MPTDRCMLKETLRKLKGGWDWRGVLAWSEAERKIDSYAAVRGGSIVGLTASGIIGHGRRGRRVDAIEREFSSLKLQSNGRYLDLEFDAISQGLTDEVASAAAVYDRLHVERSLATRKELAVSAHDDETLHAKARWGSRLNEVRRHRYVLDEKYDPTCPTFVQREAARPRRVRLRWRLDDSVWRPRLTSGNSRSFFETDDSLRRTFDADWGMAKRNHNLEWVLVRTTLELSQWRSFDRSKVEGHPVVQAVERALWSHARMIYGAFDYYASDPTCTSMLFHGEPDVFKVHFNGFVMFCRDCQLCSRSSGFNEGQLETIFIEVDTVDSDLKPHDGHNRRKALNRHEWLGLVVRIAMRKWLPRDARGNLRGDAGAALERLLRDDLEPNLPAEAVQNRDTFRRLCCYTMRVDAALRRRGATLRALYQNYAREVNRATQTHYALADVSLMSVGEFCALLGHTQLFAMGLLTPHAAKRAFLASRMRSVADYSDASEVRMRHLLFEDFMEALVRIACMVALPSWEEIGASGASDAGEFLLAMAEHHPPEYKSFLDERSGSWQAQYAPMQAPHECVEHLVALIVRQVERGVGVPRGPGISVGDDVVTLTEALAFLRQRESGAQLTGVSSDGLKGGEMLSALEAVAGRVRETLHRVEAFSAMSTEQLETLRRAMSIAKFEAGECVFNQGEVGDMFFIITSGEATVLRADPCDLDGDEYELAQLAEGACFGERALLRNDVRFASIVAITRLFTLCIDRDRFEEALGPLRNLVPDTYQ